MASGSSGASDNPNSHSNLSVPVSASNSRSITTTTEIDYCIRAINYMISTLQLPTSQVQSLEQVTLELLLRIHCALFGIDFSKEFIPSSHPREDVERMILSLKDRFGTDKFGALDARKIANKNPTQLRFLLENFHLILSHQMVRSGRSSRSVASDLVTSKSGNHLGVWTPSSTNLKQDSFYVLPHQQVPDESFLEQYLKDSTTNGDNETDDSFQTVENIVLHVYEETTSDEPSSDPMFKSGVNPDSSLKATPPKTTITRKTPLTSSPIVKDGKLSRNHQSPNISSIRHSRSAISNVVPMMGSANPPGHTHRRWTKNWKQPPPRSPSLNRDRSHVSSTVQKTQPSAVKVLAKNDRFDKPTIARKTPLTSSPIVKDGKLSRNYQNPNISSITHSRSAINNVVPTMDSANPSNHTHRQWTKKWQPSHSQSFNRDRSHVSSTVQKTQPSAVKVLAKNDRFGKTPFSTSSTQNQNKSSGPQQDKRSETEFMSFSSEDSSKSKDDPLKKVRDVHTSIRNQISESLISLDKDISKLKRKPTKSKASQSHHQYQQECCSAPIPRSLRWLMPVDCRFPNHVSGVIIPKCTSWRHNLRTTLARSSSEKKFVQPPWRDSEQLSTVAQKGSRLYAHPCEEEQDVIYDE